jgi:hypothetical protein
VRVGVIERLLVFAAHAELRAADARPQHAIRPDRIGGDGQAAQRAPHVVERHSGVDQRAKDHVSRGAGEAVEVQNPQIPSILSRSPIGTGARTPDAGSHLQLS